MKQRFTNNPRRNQSAIIFTLAFLVLSLFAAGHANAQTYVPITISSGFNHDVIANGSGMASASTTRDLDGSGAVLYASGFNCGSVGPFGLPSDRIINSSGTPGVNYQLASYSANNALFLQNNGEQGTLTFQNPGSYARLSILATSAGTPDSPTTFTARVNFSDGTYSDYAFTVPDWCYPGSVSFSLARGNNGRVQRTYCSFDNPGPNGVSLYDNIIILTSSDQAKLVTSIRFTKTIVSDKTAIFAVCGITVQGAPPAVVATAATNVTGNSFTANWNVASGATSYRLDVSTSSTFSSFLPGYNNLNVGDVTSYPVTGLNPGTTYYYRLRAVNSSGSSPNSNRITVSTLTPSLSISGTLDPFTTSAGTPSAPQTFTFSGSNLIANATVTAPASYEVSTDGDNFYPSVNVTPTGGTITDQTIYVRIAASASPGSPSGNVTVASTGAPTQNVAVTGTVTGPPTVTTQAASAIAETTATGNGNITSVNGINPTNRGVIYYVYDGTDKIIGHPDVTNISETGTFGTGPFTASLTGLAVNTRYSTRAHAENTDGTGYGDRVEFWTLANVPGAPTVSSPTATTLDVSVNPNGNPPDTEFAISITVNGTEYFVQTDGSYGPTPVWQTAGVWGTTTVTGLETGKTYPFQVKARNGDNVETDFGPSASGITCVNPTDGGTIAASQDICSGTSPAAFTSVLLPSGHGGTLEYQWQKSTTSASSGFSDIIGATSEAFDETASLTQTTWYRRLARVTCDPVGWASATASNAVQVTVEPTPVSGSLTKNPDVASVVMSTTVSVTFTEGSGGNGTDQLQYRTHDGTSWSSWENYTSNASISSFKKTKIEVQTWREAAHCPPAGIVSVSWDVLQTTVKNVDKKFVYYEIKDAVGAASPSNTICIGTNTYIEDVDTSGKGGLILQAGCNNDDGVIEITADFSLSEEDELKMELFGDNVYDKFIIGGDAEINGASLDIKVASGYEPAAGTRFIILTSPNNPGEFSNPTLVKTNGHQFILSYEEDNGIWNVVLTSLAPLLKLEIHHIESRP